MIYSAFYLSYLFLGKLLIYFNRRQVFIYFERRRHGSEQFTDHRRENVLAGVLARVFHSVFFINLAMHPASLCHRLANNVYDLFITFLHSYYVQAVNLTLVWELASRLWIEIRFFQNNFIGVTHLRDRTHGCVKRVRVREIHVSVHEIEV